MAETAYFKLFAFNKCSIFTNFMKFRMTAPRGPHWIQIVFILMLAVVGSGLLAQEMGSLAGRVVDHKTGDGLPGVNIQVMGTSRGTMSDLDGYFNLSNLPPAGYQLRFTMMGYVPMNLKDVQVAAGLTGKLNIALKQNILASPEVVVTSSRKDQDILESPFSVSAIGPREIQAKAMVNMVDLLSYQPGVSTIKGQLNIRGASGYTLGAGSRSLLLVDGIPLLGSAAGNISWETIPTSEVDRVEIVRSGGSAMYGSSAMGGVVNIITRNAPPEPETRISTQLGHYSRPRIKQWEWPGQGGLFYNAELSHSRSFGQHAAWFRVQQRQNDGFMALNWEKALNLSGKVKLNFGNAHSAAILLNILKDDSGLLSTWKSPADPFEAPAGSEDDHTEAVKTVLNSHYNYVHSPDLSLKLKGSLYTNVWENFGADPDHSNEKRYFGELQANRNWSPTLSTVSGFATQTNVVKAQIFGEHDSRSLALYLLAQQQIGDFTLSLGGRGETYAVDGEALDQVLTPQLALNWKPLSWMSMRISTGQGFRVPTIAEMFTRARRSIFTVEPNPNLISETSVSREAGLSIILGETGPIDLLKFDAAVFHNRFENMIEPVPDSLAIIHFENISQARILGLDVGLGVSFLDNLLDLKTSYTWLDPVALDADGNPADTLSYRYRHHWVSTTGLHLHGVDLSLEYRYASKLEGVELFPENSITGADRQVPVHVWNMGLGTSRKLWRVQFRIENIFQYYYTQLERNMESERSFALTLERRL